MHNQSKASLWSLYPSVHPSKQRQKGALCVVHSWIEDLKNFWPLCTDLDAEPAAVYDAKEIFSIIHIISN